MPKVGGADVHRGAGDVRGPRRPTSTSWRTTLVITTSPSAMISRLASAIGMKTPGGTVPSSGSVPAGERLDLAQLARREVDDRLVVDLDRLVGDGAAQFRGEREAAARVVGGAGVADDPARRRSAWPGTSPRPRARAARCRRGRRRGTTLTPTLAVRSRSTSPTVSGRERCASSEGAAGRRRVVEVGPGEDGEELVAAVPPEQRRARQRVDDTRGERRRATRRRRVAEESLTSLNSSMSA